MGFQVKSAKNPLFLSFFFGPPPSREKLLPALLPTTTLPHSPASMIWAGPSSHSFAHASIRQVQQSSCIQFIMYIQRDIVKMAQTQVCQLRPGFKSVLIYSLLTSLGFRSHTCKVRGLSSIRLANPNAYGGQADKRNEGGQSGVSNREQQRLWQIRKPMPGVKGMFATELRPTVPMCSLAVMWIQGCQRSHIPFLFFQGQ